MLNIKGIIKSVIVSNVGNLIEDFTEDDIVIDRWNGRIQKENVKIKKDAFEWLTKTAFGAPCTVVKGYIKKLQVDVPWSELQSRPLEITIEDLHVILTSSECYERKFVKNTLIELKKQKVEKLLKLIEVSGAPFYSIFLNDNNISQSTFQHKNISGVSRINCKAAFKAQKRS